jgi:hypothetical protein
MRKWQMDDHKTGLIKAKLPQTPRTNKLIYLLVKESHDSKLLIPQSITGYNI